MPSTARCRPSAGREPARTPTDASTMSPDVHGFGGMVVSPHVLATQAGMDMLSKGGTAADAAIAANAVQGVVAPETCGIGGDLFALVWVPGMDRPEALDAAGTAGSNADPDELRREGLTEIPSRHPASITIPGCVAGWAALHLRHGRLPLEDLLQPAIRLAREGFPASNELVRATVASHDTIRTGAGGAEILPGGRPAHPGERVVRHNLATTLTEVAHRGAAAFYQGRVAEAICRAVDGRITTADLSAYAPEWVEPATLEVFGLTGWTMPPPSQGYLILATLAAYERLTDGAVPDESDRAHLLIEAYRSFAWERNEVLADPRHAGRSWRQLLDPSLLAERADRIDPERAGAWPPPGPGPGGTAYMCTVDSAGMGVSLMQSNFRGLGSGIGAGDTGLILHNRGEGFDLRPGHPNELAPGKRPLHTLSPSLWTGRGTLAAMLGTRGGHQQPQFVAQMASLVFGQGLSPAAAQRTGRWKMSEFGPGAPPSVLVESTVSTSVVESLARRGHRIEVAGPPAGSYGPVSMITVDAAGLRTGAADPRVDTSAAAAH